MEGNSIINDQITVVFQGSINLQALDTGLENGSDFLYNLARTREALPNAKFILSTWETLSLPEQYNSAQKLGVDELVLSSDPGGLPNIKFGYDAPNNVNRQIISTRAGLSKVTTNYALKLRSDSFLVNDNLLQFYAYYINQVQSDNTSLEFDYSPIVVPNFFTIDPTMYEHIAFHISDWAQFATTDKLIDYWSADLMTKENATYFERHIHNTQGQFADNAFRTRLAVEQHIATLYAEQRGYLTPTYYNEITESILHAHNEFLAKEVIVLDMADYGLCFPKYAWTLSDEFMAINCLNHDDWYQLFYEYWYPNQVDATRLLHAQQRLSMKQMASEAFNRSDAVSQSKLLNNLYPS